MTNFMVSGNISRAAETRTVTNPQGQKTFATSFNVAVQDGFGENEITTFWKVTVWGQLGANLAPYLTLGKRVDVKGIPGQEKPWTGEDGQTRAGMLTIRRAEIELVGKKGTPAPADDNFEGEIVGE